MDCLPKEKLKDADDRPIEPLKLDERLYGKGAQLLLRPWSGDVRSKLETLVSENKKHDVALFRWFVAQQTLVDATGAPYLANEDRGWFMGEKNGAMVEAVFDRACVMNGISKEEREEIEKNSDDGQ